ncbi:uncharacterized protein LOC123195508 isoform X2 [Mangifera indica]|uniref:uncharacterized protein LOC123195508 isoform X2 n=1 Tax=Mangifera indica TaxID=29780 RepID=UPI001CF9D43F|nr:uncharacterized protein LOC123195508 isoform X2 [Mangifera indica]
MVYLMSLFEELMDMIMILLLKPFCLCKPAIMFCLKSTFFVIHCWMDLVNATISFNVNLICRTMSWTVALVTLPLRVFTALQRERLLEQQMNEMQVELETLVWDRKELEVHLQNAIKEGKIMESMLAELEDENDNTMAKIELLEGELQCLKDETLQLKEICGKEWWSFKVNNKDNGQIVGGTADNLAISYGFSSWKSNFTGTDFFFRDVMTHKDAWASESKSDAEFLDILKTGIAANSGSIHPYIPGVIPRNIEMSKVLDQRRGVALSQSLFSAVLSLLVGMIIWEAEDPCMPLVVALFTVVGMSLKSVVQFFSTIKNKPASDAVALLSFNWFILGTLTYPTLPKVARVLSPLAFRFYMWTGI